MKNQETESVRSENLEELRGGATFNGAVAFHVLQVAFAKALEKNPESFHESFYTFAGQKVHLRVVGRALAKNILPSFAHLQTNGSAPRPPRLTIDLWDQHETGVRCQVRFAHDNLGWTDLIAKSPDSRFVGQQQPHTFACLDRRTSRIIGSISWSEPIGVYERAKPLSRLLLEWHNDQNRQVIHAGLLAWNNQGILLVGKSGSGKSTATLACLCAGFTYLSEDYVGLQRLTDGSFVGHSLYNSVFLNSSHLARFSSLTPYVITGRPDEKKSAVILSQVFPERLERVVPIRVLLIPRVTGTRESKISPASKGQALLTLGPSSLLQLASRRGAHSFTTLAQLVEQVPCYWLESGYDLDSIPRCVAELVAEAVPS
jgi:hypothetical protein